MKSAVHFGAGAIGRGFIGDLLHDSGFEIVFVDVDHVAMSNLTTAGSYRIYRVNDHRNCKIIDHVRGLSPVTQTLAVIEAIVNADFITTAVWANNLAKVAPIIAEGLAERFRCGKQPVNVVACENAIRATDILKREIIATGALTEEQLKLTAAFPNTAVDRMVFPVEVAGVKSVEVGAEFELPIERSRLVDPLSRPIKGAEYTDDLDKFLERKLYVVNCCHVLAGFYGYLRGFDYVLQSFEDEQVLKDVQAAIQESACALTKKYNFKMDEFEPYLAFVVRRYQTPGVKDPVGRVCRNPIRKLAANERLIGPTALCEAYGVANLYLCRGVAAAFLFDGADDVEAAEIQTHISNNGIEAAVQHFTGLSATSVSSRQIVASYHEHKATYCRSV